MSVTGVCQVCEAAEARHSCDQCGALVCADHFDRAYETCVRCAPTDGTQPSGEGPPSSSRGSPDDFDVMR